MVNSVADTVELSTLPLRFLGIDTTLNHMRTASTTSMERQITADESTMPRSCHDSARVVYAEMPAMKTPPEQLVQQNDIPPIPKFTARAHSPIKARAAAFEKIHHDKDMVTSLLHDDRGHHSQHRGPNATISSVSSIREKLETRHHLTRETPRAVHTPPIPLALPQLIDRFKKRSISSRSASDGYDTAPESSNISCLPTPPPAPQPEVAPPAAPDLYQETKGSISWPYKMNLFRHDKSAPAVAKTFHAEAMAEPEKDEHTTDSSIEYIKRYMNASPLKPAKVLTRKPSQKELRGRNSKASLHESLHEVLRPRTDSDGEAIAPHSEPTTPKKQSVQDPAVQTPEKQNAEGWGKQTPKKSGTPAVKSTTLGASSLASPFRGRRRAERARSRGEDAYTVEQRYSLSRSRSRGGVTIQVEVRSPEASPDRPDGDHLIIIRANVEPMEEELE